MTYSDAELEAAVDALSDLERFAEAEELVTRAAPQLQRILAQALNAGGWFAETHETEVQKARGAEDPAAAVRIMLAEEARMGMMVGVAVGWALAEQLRKETHED